MNLVWTIEFSPTARKDLRKLGASEAERILRALEGIAELDDPRQRGHGLLGELSGYWRYRAGDWRVICRIEQERLVILVVTVGHRREVYR